MDSNPPASSKKSRIKQVYTKYLNFLWPDFKLKRALNEWCLDQT